MASNISSIRIIGSGIEGRSENHFAQPRGICIDLRQKEIYVCDCNNHRVQVFSSDSLTFIRQIGRGIQGSSSGSLNYAVGMCLDPINRQVFVADTNNHRVVVFDQETGTHIRNIGSQGAGLGQVSSPYGVCVDHQTGMLFVADYDNHRVQVFNKDTGEYERVVGLGFGSAPGQMNQPIVLCIDDETGYLYVADYSNNRVQVFDKETGEFIRQIGGDATGLGSDALSGPRGLCMDFASGLLFVADRENHRIKIYNKHTFAFIRHIGDGQGSAPGQFNRPMEMCINSEEGSLLVVDGYNHRVQLMLIPELQAVVKGKKSVRKTKNKDLIGNSHTKASRTAIMTDLSQAIVIFNQPHLLTGSQSALVTSEAEVRDAAAGASEFPPAAVVTHFPEATLRFPSLGPAYDISLTLAELKGLSKLSSGSGAKGLKSGIPTVGDKGFAQEKEGREGRGASLQQQQQEEPPITTSLLHNDDIASSRRQAILNKQARTFMGLICAEDATTATVTAADCRDSPAPAAEAVAVAAPIDVDKNTQYEKDTDGRADDNAITSNNNRDLTVPAAFGLRALLDRKWQPDFIPANVIAKLVQVLFDVNGATTSEEERVRAVEAVTSLLVTAIGVSPDTSQHVLQSIVGLARDKERNREDVVVVSAIGTSLLLPSTAQGVPTPVPVASTARRSPTRITPSSPSRHLSSSPSRILPSSPLVAAAATANDAARQRLLQLQNGCDLNSILYLLARVLAAEPGWNCAAGELSPGGYFPQSGPPSAYNNGYDDTVASAGSATTPAAGAAATAEAAATGTTGTAPSTTNGGVPAEKSGNAQYLKEVTQLCFGAPFVNSMLRLASSLPAPRPSVLHSPGVGAGAAGAGDNSSNMQLSLDLLNLLESVFKLRRAKERRETLLISHGAVCALTEIGTALLRPETAAVAGVVSSSAVADEDEKDEEDGGPSFAAQEKKPQCTTSSSESITSRTSRDKDTDKEELGNELSACLAAIKELQLQLFAQAALCFAKMPSFSTVKPSKSLYRGGRHIWQPDEPLAVGDLVDAMDKEKSWFESYVTEILPYTGEVKVHFMGWGSKWDDTVSEAEMSNRIAPLNTRTKNWRADLFEGGLIEIKCNDDTVNQKWMWGKIIAMNAEEAWVDVSYTFTSEPTVVKRADLFGETLCPVGMHTKEKSKSAAASVVRPAIKVEELIRARKAAALASQDTTFCDPEDCITQEEIDCSDDIGDDGKGGRYDEDDDDSESSDEFSSRNSSYKRGTTSSAYDYKSTSAQERKLGPPSFSSSSYLHYSASAAQEAIQPPGMPMHGSTPSLLSCALSGGKRLRRTHSTDRSRGRVHARELSFEPSTAVISSTSLVSCSSSPMEFIAAVLFESVMTEVVNTVSDQVSIDIQGMQAVSLADSAQSKAAKSSSSSSAFNTPMRPSPFADGKSNTPASGYTDKGRHSSEVKKAFPSPMKSPPFSTPTKAILEKAASSYSSSSQHLPDSEAYRAALKVISTIADGAARRLLVPYLNRVLTVQAGLRAELMAVTTALCNREIFRVDASAAPLSAMLDRLHAVGDAYSLVLVRSLSDYDKVEVAGAHKANGSIPIGSVSNTDGSLPPGTPSSTSLPPLPPPPPLPPSSSSQPHHRSQLPVSVASLRQAAARIRATVLRCAIAPIARSMFNQTPIEGFGDSDDEEEDKEEALSADDKYEEKDRYGSPLRVGVGILGLASPASSSRLKVSSSSSHRAIFGGTNSPSSRPRFTSPLRSVAQLSAAAVSRRGSGGAGNGLSSALRRDLLNSGRFSEGSSSMRKLLSHLFQAASETDLERIKKLWIRVVADWALDACVGNDGPSVSSSSSSVKISGKAGTPQATSAFYTASTPASASASKRYPNPRRSAPKVDSHSLSELDEEESIFLLDRLISMLSKARSVSRMEFSDTNRCFMAADVAFMKAFDRMPVMVYRSLSRAMVVALDTALEHRGSSSRSFSHSHPSPSPSRPADTQQRGGVGFGPGLGLGSPSPSRMSRIGSPGGKDSSILAANQTTPATAAAEPSPSKNLSDLFDFIQVIMTEKMNYDFQADYQALLAKRLLTGKSISMLAEMSLLDSLPASTSTMPLARFMISEVEQTARQMTRFRKALIARIDSEEVSFSPALALAVTTGSVNIHVLTGGKWPTGSLSPTIFAGLKLPPALQVIADEFSYFFHKGDQFDSEYEDCSPSVFGKTAGAGRHRGRGTSYDLSNDRSSDDSDGEYGDSNSKSPRKSETAPKKRRLHWCHGIGSVTVDCHLSNGRSLTLELSTPQVVVLLALANTGASSNSIDKESQQAHTHANTKTKTQVQLSMETGLTYDELNIVLGSLLQSSLIQIVSLPRETTSSSSSFSPSVSYALSDLLLPVSGSSSLLGYEEENRPQPAIITANSKSWSEAKTLAEKQRGSLLNWRSSLIDASVVRALKKTLRDSSGAFETCGGLVDQGALALDELVTEVQQSLRRSNRGSSTAASVSGSTASASSVSSAAAAALFVSSEEVQQRIEWLIDQQIIESTPGLGVGVGDEASLRIVGYRYLPAAVPSPPGVVDTTASASSDSEVIAGGGGNLPSSKETAQLKAGGAAAGGSGSSASSPTSSGPPLFGSDLFQHVVETLGIPSTDNDNGASRRTSCRSRDRASRAAVSMSLINEEYDEDQDQEGEEGKDGAEGGGSRGSGRGVAVSVSESDFATYFTKWISSVDVRLPLCELHGSSSRRISAAYATITTDVTRDKILVDSAAGSVAGHSRSLLASPGSYSSLRMNSSSAGGGGGLYKYTDRVFSVQYTVVDTLAAALKQLFLLQKQHASGPPHNSESETTAITTGGAGLTYAEVAAVCDKDLDNHLLALHKVEQLLHSSRSSRCPGDALSSEKTPPSSSSGQQRPASKNTTDTAAAGVAGDVLDVTREIVRRLPDSTLQSLLTCFSAVSNANGNANDTPLAPGKSHAVISSLVVASSRRHSVTPPDGDSSAMSKSTGSTHAGEEASKHQHHHNDHNHNDHNQSKADEEDGTQDMDTVNGDDDQEENADGRDDSSTSSSSNSSNGYEAGSAGINGDSSSSPSSSSASSVRRSVEKELVSKWSAAVAISSSRLSAILLYGQDLGNGSASSIRREVVDLLLSRFTTSGAATATGTALVSATKGAEGGSGTGILLSAAAVAQGDRQDKADGNDNGDGSDSDSAESDSELDSAAAMAFAFSPSSDEKMEPSSSKPTTTEETTGTNPRPPPPPAAATSSAIAEPKTRATATAAAASSFSSSIAAHGPTKQVEEEEEKVLFVSLGDFVVCILEASEKERGVVEGDSVGNMASPAADMLSRVSTPERFTFPVVSVPSVSSTFSSATASFAGLSLSTPFAVKLGGAAAGASGPSVGSVAGRRLKGSRVGGGGHTGSPLTASERRRSKTKAKAFAANISRSQTSTPFTRFHSADADTDTDHNPADVDADAKNDTSSFETHTTGVTKPFSFPKFGGIASSSSTSTNSASPVPFSLSAVATTADSASSLSAVIGATAASSVSSLFSAVLPGVAGIGAHLPPSSSKMSGQQQYHHQARVGSDSPKTSLRRGVAPAAVVAAGGENRSSNFGGLFDRERGADACVGSSTGSSSSDDDGADAEGFDLEEGETQSMIMRRQASLTGTLLSFAEYVNNALADTLDGINIDIATDIDVTSACDRQSQHQQHRYESVDDFEHKSAGDSSSFSDLKSGMMPPVWGTDRTGSTSAEMATGGDFGHGVAGGAGLSAHFALVDMTGSVRKLLDNAAKVAVDQELWDEAQAELEGSSSSFADVDVLASSSVMREKKSTEKSSVNSKEHCSFSGTSAAAASAAASGSSSASMIFKGKEVCLPQWQRMNFSYSKLLLRTFRELDRDGDGALTVEDFEACGAIPKTDTDDAVKEAAGGGSSGIKSGGDDDDVINDSIERARYEEIDRICSKYIEVIKVAAVADVLASESDLTMYPIIGATATTATSSNSSGTHSSSSSTSDGGASSSVSVSDAWNILRAKDSSSFLHIGDMVARRSLVRTENPAERSQSTNQSSATSTTTSNERIKLACISEVHVLVTRICEAFPAIVPDTVLDLLVKHDWSVNSLIDSIGESASAAGSSPLSAPSEPPTYFTVDSSVQERGGGDDGSFIIGSSSPGSVCYSCNSTMRPTEAFALRCRHWHCRRCWLKVIKSSIPADSDTAAGASSSSSSEGGVSATGSGTAGSKYTAGTGTGSASLLYPQQQSDSDVSQLFATAWTCPHPLGCNCRIEGDFVETLCGSEARRAFYICRLKEGGERLQQQLEATSPRGAGTCGTGTGTASDITTAGRHFHGAAPRPVSSTAVARGCVVEKLCSHCHRGNHAPAPCVVMEWWNTAQLNLVTTAAAAAAAAASSSSMHSPNRRSGSGNNSKYRPHSSGRVSNQATSLQLVRRRKFNAYIDAAERAWLRHREGVHQVEDVDDPAAAASLKQCTDSWAALAKTNSFLAHCIVLLAGLDAAFGGPSPESLEGPAGSGPGPGPGMIHQKIPGVDLDALIQPLDRHVISLSGFLAENSGFIYEGREALAHAAQISLKKSLYQIRIVQEKVLAAAASLSRSLPVSYTSGATAPRFYSGPLPTSSSHSFDVNKTSSSSSVGAAQMGLLSSAFAYRRSSLTVAGVRVIVPESDGDSPSLTSSAAGNKFKSTAASKTMMIPPFSSNALFGRAATSDPSNIFAFTDEEQDPDPDPQQQQQQQQCSCHEGDSRSFGIAPFHVSTAKRRSDRDASLCRDAVVGLRRSCFHITTTGVRSAVTLPEKHLKTILKLSISGTSSSSTGIAQSVCGPVLSVISLFTGDAEVCLLGCMIMANFARSIRPSEIPTPFSGLYGIQQGFGSSESGSNKQQSKHLITTNNELDNGDGDRDDEKLRTFLSSSRFREAVEKVLEMHIDDDAIALLCCRLIGTTTTILRSIRSGGTSVSTKSQSSSSTSFTATAAATGTTSGPAASAAVAVAVAQERAADTLALLVKAMRRRTPTASSSSSSSVSSLAIINTDTAADTNTAAVAAVARDRRAAAVCEEALSALVAIATQFGGKKVPGALSGRFANSDAHRTVTAAAMRYQTYGDVSRQFCSVVGHFTCSNSTLQTRFGDCGVVEQVVRLINEYIDDAAFCQQGSWALGNLVYLHQRNADRFTVSGGCEAIVEVLRRSTSTSTALRMQAFTCISLCTVGQLSATDIKERFRVAGAVEVLESILRELEVHLHSIRKRQQQQQSQQQQQQLDGGGEASFASDKGLANVSNRPATTTTSTYFSNRLRLSEFVIVPGSFVSPPLLQALENALASVAAPIALPRVTDDPFWARNDGSVRVRRGNAKQSSGHGK